MKKYQPFNNKNGHHGKDAGATNKINEYWLTDESLRRKNEGKSYGFYDSSKFCEGAFTQIVMMRQL